jgi:hypothetical protein
MSDMTSTEQTSSIASSVGARLSTESLTKKRVTAGKLTDTGETFIPKTIETRVSQKNGEFFVLTGDMEDGRPIEVVFSSEKLHRLLTTHWDRLVGKQITLSGRGSGYDREYVIEMVG